MHIKNILFLTIWTIIVLLVGLLVGNVIATKNMIEYDRCNQFSSGIVDHNQESCYAAGCKPDSPGGEWQCIPK